MNLYFRLMLLLIKRSFGFKKIDLFDACDTEFRVAPSDLDVNMHMNNGVYLSLMDLGRVDMMIRAGIFKKLMKNGYYPVVASESIRFKKSLEPFQKFTMITQIDSIDEKDFYIGQKFYVKGTLYAEGFIKGRFKQRGRKGSVPTPELFESMGIPYTNIPFSEKAKAQFAVERLLTAEDKSPDHL